MSKAAYWNEACALLTAQADLDVMQDCLDRAYQKLDSSRRFIFPIRSIVDFHLAVFTASG